MEWVLLGVLGFVGLIVIGVIGMVLAAALWIVALPFRIIGWTLGVVVGGVKLLLFIPLLCLGVCALLLVSPFLLAAMLFF